MRCFGRTRAAPSRTSAATSISVAPAVKRRVDRLERDGVLLGYTAIVDPEAFGWHAEAFVDLYCEGTMAAGAIKAAVQSEPGVIAAHTVAGEASALLHIRGA